MDRVNRNLELSVPYQNRTGEEVLIKSTKNFGTASDLLITVEPVESVAKFHNLFVNNGMLNSMSFWL